MDKSLFDKNGEAVAYITDDYHRTIYLWDGQQVAYLYNDRLVYGINGRHLGWFIDGVIYDNGGERIGFTAEACPVSPSKEPSKLKKQLKDEMQTEKVDKELARLMVQWGIEQEED